MRVLLILTLVSIVTPGLVSCSGTTKTTGSAGEKPAAESLPSNLTAEQAIQRAKEYLASQGRDLQGYPEPSAEYYLERQEWRITFARNLSPGDYLIVHVNDLNGDLFVSPGR